MRTLAIRIEFHKLMPIDRLHHANLGEQQRAAIFCGLSDAMRGGLNLFHPCVLTAESLSRATQWHASA